MRSGRPVFATDPFARQGSDSHASWERPFEASRIFEGCGWGRLLHLHAPKVPRAKKGSKDPSRASNLHEVD